MTLFTAVDDHFSALDIHLNGENIHCTARGFTLFTVNTPFIKRSVVQYHAPDRETEPTIITTACLRSMGFLISKLGYSSVLCLDSGHLKTKDGSQTNIQIQADFPFVSISPVPLAGAQVYTTNHLWHERMRHVFPQTLRHRTTPGGCTNPVSHISVNEE